MQRPVGSLAIFLLIAYNEIVYQVFAVGHHME